VLVTRQSVIWNKVINTQLLQRVSSSFDLKHSLLCQYWSRVVVFLSHQSQCNQANMRHQRTLLSNCSFWLFLVGYLQQHFQHHIMYNLFYLWDFYWTTWWSYEMSPNKLTGKQQRILYWFALDWKPVWVMFQVLTVMLLSIQVFCDDISCWVVQTGISNDRSAFIPTWSWWWKHHHQCQLLFTSQHFLISTLQKAKQNIFKKFVTTSMKTHSVKVKRWSYLWKQLLFLWVPAIHFVSVILRYLMAVYTMLLPYQRWIKILRQWPAVYMAPLPYLKYIDTN
jgi:hypothetical protein